MSAEETADSFGMYLERCAEKARRCFAGHSDGEKVMCVKRKMFEPGWIVVLAGLGVNLALGVLYAWGVISAALIDQLGWSATATQIPYMVACAVFALSMVPGGRLQDKYGPRPVIMAAAVFAGVGFLLSGVVMTPVGLTAFFGVVFGIGMGMGYAAPTPAAVKWFSRTKRGLISGIVVSGFGLAPVYIAPLTSWLLDHFTLAHTFMIMGAGFFVLIMTLAMFIRNPPAGHIAEPLAVPDAKNVPAAGVEIRKEAQYDWSETFETTAFKRLWIMFCFGTFAGLLIIGQLSKIGIEQAGADNVYIKVGIYAIFNCIGRIACGILSDRFGRMRTLFTLFLLQVVTYVFFAQLETTLTLGTGVAIVGFTFGGMLSVFPAVTADYFGMKNFGVNYGMLLTAWGVGGVFGPLVGGIVRDMTGTYLISYIISGVLSATGAYMTFATKAPVEKEG